MVAFAALFPIISVLAYGQLAVLKERVSTFGSDERDRAQEETMHFKLIVAFAEDSKPDDI